MGRMGLTDGQIIDVQPVKQQMKFLFVVDTTGGSPVRVPVEKITSISIYEETTKRDMLVLKSRVPGNPVIDLSSIIRWIAILKAVNGIPLDDMDVKVLTIAPQQQTEEKKQ
jgi:hypothetical protein